jgi:hypothetical protein
LGFCDGILGKCFDGYEELATVFGDGFKNHFFAYCRESGREYTGEE